MKKIFILTAICALLFSITQADVLAQTEFVYGTAPKIEETRLENGDDFFLARIFDIDGAPYIYKTSKTNPVPYDKSLSEIIDKNYIITDNYYIAYDYKNSAAISGGAYIPFTTLLIYDRQMNLLHEEDFGGGVCVYGAGYCGGTVYCQYAEKLEEVSENGNYQFKRSDNPYIDRNNPREKIEWTTVKSTDMVNWEECGEDISISNSRASILGDKISLFEKEPVSVAYESVEEYTLNKTQPKLGDWFLVLGTDKGEHLLKNIYLTNDFIYFVPINIPAEAKEAFNRNQVSILGDVYEYDGNIIVNYEDLKYYLTTPADEIYSKLKQIKDAPYIKLNNTILGFETPPIIEDGSTLVPIRFLFEQMGATVDWEQATRTATISQGDKTITFTIDNTTAAVNGTPATMTVPARLINGKTMVPLRFLSENLGYTVDWDADSRTAIIE